MLIVEDEADNREMFTEVAKKCGADVRSIRVNAAIRNAAVLPVPVCDWPATSLPRSANGSAASWIGVSVTNPASRIPCMTGSGKSREAKSI